MSDDAAKRAAAQAALPLIAGHALIGVGTGSTADAFIDLLACCEPRLHGAIASSERTARRLHAAGIGVLPLGEFDSIPVYVDGADEVDPGFRLVKGAGGAATREKIVASMAETFVCIVDESKVVDVLGGAPLAVEVLRPAEAYVTRRLRELGGVAHRRIGFTSDDGNHILDVVGLPLAEDPLALERELDAIPGVAGHGLFASRPADVLVIGTPGGEAAVRRR